MNQKDFEALVHETMQQTGMLLVLKGGEYAGNDDCLANFKRGAALTGVTPLQCLFIYLSKHYDALANYVRKDASGDPIQLSEPIEGRLDDLINYCLLAKALIRESAPSVAKVTAASLADRVRKPFPGSLEDTMRGHHAS